VTVCGLNSSSCPAGGKGVLSSKGPSGVNRVTGNNVSAILGTLTADASGHNQLVYDGDPDRAPLVLGQVTPAASIIVDQTVMPCPICGDGTIEPPETCDDGNQNDGDGCSSTCQIEAAIPGDANGDSMVTPDDIGFCISEIFDGDGDSVTMVSGGSFPASPGVDANGDKFVNAADVTATIKHIPTQ
jgi:cysteine-rich repeat protein